MVNGIGVDWAGGSGIVGADDGIVRWLVVVFPSGSHGFFNSYVGFWYDPNLPPT